MKYSVIKENIAVYNRFLNEAGLFEMAKQFDPNKTYWGSGKDRTDIVLAGMPDEKTAEAFLDASLEVEDNKAYQEALLLLQLAKEGDAAVIKSLGGFMKGLEKYIASNIKRGWLYKRGENGIFLPYLVTKMNHKKADPINNREACVEITFDYSSPKKEETRHTSNMCAVFKLKEVHGSTVPQILADKGFYKENEEFDNDYAKNIEAYEKHVEKMGKQFWAAGTGDDIFRNNFEDINVKLTKVVNNEDINKRKQIRQTTKISILEGVRTGLGYLDEEQIDIENTQFEDYQVPFHPLIKVFNLETHKDFWIMAANLKPYEYDENLGEKLILPEDHYDLIDILVNDADVVLDDIVSGKSGGTNILCKGEAGLGKTLTAEVYSEVVGKPLYSVHSGQLGNDPETIDKKLKEVLDRATRWGAILLLDEADVYIRKRDNSMSHNAIVAAFLRQLERFDGIIFLTTNREDDVDDAISSRCIAIISYDYPEKTRLTAIWKMLSRHYGIELSDDLISKIIDSIDKMAGRDVKELLKLASKYNARRGSEMNYETFRKCALFRGLKFSHHEDICMKKKWIECKNNEKKSED